MNLDNNDTLIGLCRHEGEKARKSGDGKKCQFYSRAFTYNLPVPQTIQSVEWLYDSEVRSMKWSWPKLWYCPGNWLEGLPRKSCHIQCPGQTATSQICHKRYRLTRLAFRERIKDWHTVQYAGGNRSYRFVCKRDQELLFLTPVKNSQQLSSWRTQLFPAHKGTANAQQARW